MATQTRSFEAFIDAVAAINAGAATVGMYDHKLASVATTYRTTAILEAGRVSLDSNGTVEIRYDNPAARCQPTSLVALNNNKQTNH